MTRDQFITLMLDFHERLGDKICWEWPGAIGKAGYGNLSLDGKSVNAHRAAYIIMHGPLDRSIMVCHQCDNRPCFNVNHLFPGTQLDNVMDASIKGRLDQKLSAADIMAIFVDRRVNREIADDYGVSESTISRVKLQKYRLRGLCDYDGEIVKKFTGRKLTADMIPAIREDQRSQAKIAMDYGVSQPVIGKIKRGIIWSHVK